VAGAGTVAGIAETAVSAAYDYYLQSNQLPNGRLPPLSGRSVTAQPVQDAAPLVGHCVQPRASVDGDQRPTAADHLVGDGNDICSPGQSGPVDAGGSNVQAGRTPEPDALLRDGDHRQCRAAIRRRQTER
jgi:hypothetical protein